MAKKNTPKTSNKELKPKIQDKKVIAKPFPTTEKVKIYFFKTKEESTVTNEIAKILVRNKRAKLV